MRSATRRAWNLANRVALAPLIGGFAFKQLWGKSAFKAYFKESYLSRDERIPSARLEHYYESFNTPAARASALATLRATRDTRSVVAIHRPHHDADAGALGTRRYALSRGVSASACRARFVTRAFNCSTQGTSRTRSSRGDVAHAIERFCQNPRLR
jgi:hypothetical protein